MATAPTFVQATHNMLYTMNDAKWRQDLAKSGKAAVVVGYQEAEGSAARATLAAWHKEQNRGLWHPRGSGNPIGWGKWSFPSVVKVDGAPFRGFRTSHLSAPSMGVDAKFNPARDFSWVGLQHRGGERILFVNVHPLAGGTKPEADPGNTDSDQLSRYKDWGVGQYWLDVTGFVAGEMSRNEGEKSMAPFWDSICLMGDYNASLENRDRWYYPGSLLPALFRPDPQPKGLDHIQATHGSNLVAGRRWTQKGNTDHLLNYQSWSIKAVSDFPRQ